MIIGTKYKNALQHIYEQTSNEIIDDIAKSLVSNETKNNFYKIPQQTVVKIESNLISKSLISKYHTSDYGGGKTFSMPEFNISLIDFNLIFKTYIEAIKMTLDILKSINIKTVYGVIFIVDEGDNEIRYINPFHPIIAERFIQNENEFNDINISGISIYNFPKTHSMEKYDENILKDSVIDIAKIIKLIKVSSNAKISYENVKHEQSEISYIDYIEYDKFIITDNDEKIQIDEDNDFYMIPNQILNYEGVAYPYYGTTISTNGLAFNVSPMYSANISHPSYKTSGEITGSKICTHSGKAFTIDGVSALNHSNMTSPLNSSIIRTGSFEYILKSIEFSIEIYKEFLEEEKNKKYNFTEFVFKNPKSKSTDYISYLKEYYENHQYSDKDQQAA